MEQNFCNKCGNKLSKGSLFCNKCGHNINGEDSMQEKSEIKHMECPRCHSTDFQFMTNSNVHSSWLTGRTITTNRGEYLMCKHCGCKFSVFEGRYTVMSDKEKQKVENIKILFFLISLIFALWLTFKFIIK